MLHTYSGASARTWLKVTLGTLGFCGALLAAPAAHAQVGTATPKLEAENGILSNEAAKVDDASSLAGTGPSSGGWVDYKQNSAVAFLFTAPDDGLYDVVIRYESRFGYKVGNLSVGKKGDPVGVYFNGTAKAVYAGFTSPSANFVSTNPITISLKKGVDSVYVAGGYGFYGIDYIQIAKSAATQASRTPSTAGRVEAEAGRQYYAQALVKDGDAAGSYSGSSYVSSFSGIGTLTLPVTVATDGLYQIAVGARNSAGEHDKQFDLAVTTGTSIGGKLTTALGAADANFKPYVVGKYNLVAGTTTITISSTNGYVDIDYVDITPTTGVATAARAGAEAQKALSAYPNPTNGQALNVSLELAKAQETTFDLVNALGQRVSSATRSLRAGSNQLQLPTAGVSGGIYQLVVRSGDQPTLVQRVVVN